MQAAWYVYVLWGFWELETWSHGSKPAPFSSSELENWSAHGCQELFFGIAFWFFEKKKRRLSLVGRVDIEADFRWVLAHMT